MRVAHPSVWFQKTNKSPRPPDTDQPTNKGDLRPDSAASFRSLIPSSSFSAHRSTPTLSTYRTQDTHSHPFALMAHAPLPVVSSHDSTEDEEDCPVCLEPLSFSFRLPGEKPHIVPECGHALHEVCFSSRPALSIIVLHSSLVFLRLKSPLFPRAFIPPPRSPSTGIFYPTHAPLPVYHPHFSPSAPHLRARARSVEKVRDSYRIR
jgi:hypothetical protein